MHETERLAAYQEENPRVLDMRLQMLVSRADLETNGRGEEKKNKGWWVPRRHSDPPSLRPERPFL